MRAICVASQENCLNPCACRREQMMGYPAVDECACSVAMVQVTKKKKQVDIGHVENTA